MSELSRLRDAVARRVGLPPESSTDELVAALDGGGGGGLSGAVADVRAFHDAMLAVAPECAECTGDERPGLTRRGARLKWLEDEVEELNDAIIANDVTEAVDALCDIIYFAVGSGLMWVGGERMALAWSEVQRSNMDKRAPDGKVHTRPSDGKISKPPGWVGPRIAEIVWGPTP